MFNLVCPIPRKIYVAVSGGVDSMAALDFLARSHDVTVLYFAHGDTAHDQTARFHVKVYAETLGLPFVDGTVTRFKHQDESLEEYWRTERYAFFNYMNSVDPMPVVTAHHLDDAVETWVWSSLNGLGKIPEIRRGYLLRPFLATPKSELLSWAVRHNVPWIQDPSNSDMARTRNIVRANMDIIKRINPGIATVVKKKVLEMKEKLHDPIDTPEQDAIVLT